MGQVGGTILPHGEQWVDIVDDKRTVIVIRDMLQKSLKHHHGIADSIQNEDVKQEFLDMFAHDVARCEDVIARAKTRLENWQ